MIFDRKTTKLLHDKVCLEFMAKYEFDAFRKFWCQSLANCKLDSLAFEFSYGSYCTHPKIYIGTWKIPLALI